MEQADEFQSIMKADGLSRHTWIKICGITNIEDALEAYSMGVDALGFVFAPSPRRIEPVVARDIIRHLPERVLKVGIFVDQDLPEVERIAVECALSAVQLHGNESPEYCRELSLPVIKAIRVIGFESLKEMEKYREATLLLDTFSSLRRGGTGVAFPWAIAERARESRAFILSGGLNPKNVGRAIRMVRPFGVDVSSGVESNPGKKDLSKMAEFIREVKEANAAHDHP